MEFEEEGEKMNILLLLGMLLCLWSMVGAVVGIVFAVHPWTIRENYNIFQIIAGGPGWWVAVLFLRKE